MRETAPVAVSDATLFMRGVVARAVLGGGAATVHGWGSHAWGTCVAARDCIMDWRTRIAAIVLAGGSVAGCAAAADPGDAGTGMPDAGPASTGGSGPWEPATLHPNLTNLVEKSPERPPAPKPRYRVPICNANPDPCCRAPDGPGCEDAQPPAPKLPE